MVHDFVKNVDELKKDLRSFLVSPFRWRTSRVTTPLEWALLRFTSTNRAKVPRSPGVYCFLVQHMNGHFPPHGFIMYIGVTGASGSARTLYDRYGDYLAERKKNKRPKVHYMLNKYAEDIYFAYSVTNPLLDLTTLELDLNDAIIPPVVVKDFSAEVRQLVKAMS